MTTPEMIRVSEDRFETSDAALVWQMRPSARGALSNLLDWFAEEVGDGGRETAARESDDEAGAELRRHGYSIDPVAPWSAYNARALEEIEEPELAPGYALTTMRGFGDEAARVDVHRAAWAPSSFDLETFRVVQSTPPYRSDLDVLAVAPDGMPAASVLAWYDEATRTGELEPVGTHPSHRRLGLGRATSLRALQLLREAGAERACVSCRGDAGYPVPAMLYASVGFLRVSRDVVYRHSG